MKPDVNSEQLEQKIRKSETKRQPRAIIETVNRYCPFLSKVSELLKDWNEKNLKNNIDWSSEDENKLALVKERITNCKKPSYPNYNDELQMFTGASETSFSAILKQKENYIRILSSKLNNK